jgi:hypothetical protein
MTLLPQAITIGCVKVAQSSKDLSKKQYIPFASLNTALRCLIMSGSVMLENADRTPEVCCGLPDHRDRSETPELIVSSVLDSNEVVVASDDLDEVLCRETPTPPPPSQHLEPEPEPWGDSRLECIPESDGDGDGDGHEDEDEEEDEDNLDDYLSSNDSESTIYSDVEEGDVEAVIDDLIGILGNALRTENFLIAYPHIDKVKGRLIYDDGCICLKTANILAHLVLKISEENLVHNNLTPVIELLTIVLKDSNATYCFQRSLDKSTGSVKYVAFNDVWYMRRVIYHVDSVDFKVRVNIPPRDADHSDGVECDAVARLYENMSKWIIKLGNTAHLAEKMISEQANKLNNDNIFKVTGTEGSRWKKALTDSIPTWKMSLNLPDPQQRVRYSHKRTASCDGPDDCVQSAKKSIRNVLCKGCIVHILLDVHSSRFCDS